MIESLNGALHAAHRERLPVEEPSDSIQPSRRIGDRMAFRIVSIADLGPAEEPDWLWPGYIARGSVTLLTGGWKGGKTTLLKYLFRDLMTGGTLAPVPMDAPVLILSEESPSYWAERRDALGLPESILFLQRDSFSRPSRVEWIALVNGIAEEVAERGIGLVVIDTLISAWSVLNENDAGEVIDALTPIRAIAAAGAAVLLVHHPRKSGGESFTGTRGSGALPGFVDVLVELEAHDKGNPADTRRRLLARGRFDSTPAEVVIDLGPNGYTVLGDLPTVRDLDLDAAILNVLPDEGVGLTADEVRDAWTAGKVPGLTRLKAALNDGHNFAKWQRFGAGVKGDPFRYRRPPAGSGFDSVADKP